MFKYIFLIYICLSGFLSRNNLLHAQMVDANTPVDAQPLLDIATGDNWLLDFSDEFNASQVNTGKWNVLESSSSRAPRPKLSISDWWWKQANVWQENGDLVLKVDKHDANTMHCGSVNSNNLYETAYGYFEVRMKIADASKGTHTAFWFQGDNMGNVDNTANDGAEIDVFESAWLDDYTKSVVHIDGYGADHQANTKKYLTPGIHDGNYHAWGFHWTEDFMDIYYDGVFKVRYGDAKWVVNSPEFIWLSNGASFGIEGDYFTREPIGTLTHAYVDYVRVWKNVDFDAQSELECENLVWSSPTGTNSQVISNSAASNDRHVKLEAQAAGSEIIFELPIDNDGLHQITLQSLTWTSFGQYQCAIETSAGEWQEMDGTIDMYKANSSVISQTFNAIQLNAGTYKVKFACVGRSNDSGGYVGSFDKLWVKSSHDVTTSLNRRMQEALSLYPNPFNDRLCISGLDARTAVEVYNVMGVMVSKQDCQQQINLSHLQSGIYLLKIGNDIYKVQKQ
ncbi:T9SS type A sorting domain-containing protein [Carboxylicivirga sp. RSCT41]|uniref:T9SS type A sorting domain-containing protein n=1 Tax=Carboxylicivirga agarovorans TaxID=3417570 RepID=UPI003D345E27